MPRGLYVALGLLVVFSILFAWHYFLYFSTVRFFGIAGRTPRRLLAIVLFLLPASFLFSEFALRLARGPLAKAYATVSTLWLAVGLAYLLFYAAAWAAWGIARLHNPQPGRIWFGAGAVLLAALYCAYGIWNAYHPRVENVRVKIAGLPESWRGRRLVQITDLHLGLILGREFLAGVIEKVNAQSPDVVFITGDLFDGDNRNLDNLAAPLNDIRAPLGTYFVTGNHDGFMGAGKALAVVQRTKVRTLNDEMTVVDGLQILGVSYGFSRNVPAEIAKIKGFDPARPSILLYHSPGLIPQVKAAGISLQISGHTHSGQMFPFQYVTRLIYGKYYRGLHVEDGFSIYTSAGTGAWGPMFRTGNHPEITVLQLEPR